MIESDRINYYSKEQNKIGVYGLLLVLDYFENISSYEECHCIVEAIKYNNEFLKTNYPTHITRSDFEDLDNEKKRKYNSQAKKLIIYVMQMNNNNRTKLLITNQQKIKS